MGQRLLMRLKPGVPQRVHVLLAAALWTAIGCWLMVRGVWWLVDSGRLWLVLPALVLGTLKSILVLDKTAKRSLARILQLADGTCLGAVYSRRTWLLVLLMMGAGYVLRHSALPRSFLGIVYVTIGWALIVSSRHAWLSWQAGG